jgi:hypothetical protein
MAARHSNASSASIKSELLILTGRTAITERKRQWRSISTLPCRIRGRREQHCGTRRVWSLLSRRRGHDIRNDQTLPNLQKATNEAKPDRYCVLHLRKIYLAGLRPERITLRNHSHPPRLSNRAYVREPAHESDPDLTKTSVTAIHTVKPDIVISNRGPCDAGE